MTAQAERATITLDAADVAYLARRFACKDVGKMRWTKRDLNHYECDGCSAHCGCSAMNCGTETAQGELGYERRT